MEVEIPELTRWLVGILIPLVTGFIALYIQRLNAYRAAANAFRSAFLADIGLATTARWSEGIDNTIRSAIPKQELAVNEFGQYLFFTRTRFTKAWRQYKNYCQSINYHDYLASVLYPVSGHPLENPCEGFKTHVARVLSYARHV